MNKLQVIPLGGIGEFGMNCLGLRIGDEMIVIDAGMGFPEESLYGVDISIPNFDYLEEYREDLTALFLTHGHEDHIGATPYFLKQFNLPVYGSRLTLAFVERKLEEHRLLDDVLLHRVEANDVADVGSFSVEFIHASHSLVDCFSLAIRTPVGTVIHTGDYKIDDGPVIGKPYDLKTLGKYGDEGVLALLGDSTNATVPGRTPSEKAVIPDFEQIFEEAEGRLFVTTFSSSIHRIQVVFDIAREFGRHVCVLGRSMLANIDTAEELGFLDIAPDIRVGIGESRKLPEDGIVYLVTGSQGELRAVLWNLATQSYKGLSIEKGDTVVLSARIIPGNEKRISKMIGAIYRRGGNIIEEKRRLIHVSGHAAQEDIRIMTETARPKFVVPVHGEFRMLFRHKEFLRNHLGYSDDRVVLIEDGDLLEIDHNSINVTERRDVGRVFIDDAGFSEIAAETIRERKKLAYNGVVTVAVTIDRETSQLMAAPSISILGVSESDALNGTIEAAGTAVTEIVGEMTPKEARDHASLREKIRVSLRRLIRRETGARPEIVTTIIDI